MNKEQIAEIINDLKEFEHLSLLISYKIPIDSDNWMDVSKIELLGQCVKLFPLKTCVQYIGIEHILSIAVREKP